MIGLKAKIRCGSVVRSCGRADEIRAFKNFISKIGELMSEEIPGYKYPGIIYQNCIPAIRTCE